MCKHTTEMFPEHDDFGSLPSSWKIRQKRAYVENVSDWLWDYWGDDWYAIGLSLMRKGNKLKAYSVVRAIQWYLDVEMGTGWDDLHRVERVANNWLNRQERKCLTT